MSHRRKHILGMTLVEVLVGIAITTLMTVAGWRAVGALQIARDQTYADASRWQALDTFFATLEADLRRADLRNFSGDSQSVTLRLNPFNVADASETIRYRVEASESGATRVIRDAPGGAVVMGEVAALQFRYRSAPSVQTPNPTAINTINEYPRAIEISIRLAGNDADSARDVSRLMVLR